MERQPSTWRTHSIGSGNCHWNSFALRAQKSGWMDIAPNGSIVVSNNALLATWEQSQMNLKSGIILSPFNIHIPKVDDQFMETADEILPDITKVALAFIDVFCKNPDAVQSRFLSTQV